MFDIVIDEHGYNSVMTLTVVFASSQDFGKLFVGNAQFVALIQCPRYLHRQHVLTHCHLLPHQDRVHVGGAAAITRWREEAEVAAPARCALDAEKLSAGGTHDVRDGSAVDQIQRVEQRLLEHEIQSREEVLGNGVGFAFASFAPDFGQKLIHHEIHGTRKSVQRRNPSVRSTPILTLAVVHLRALTPRTWWTASDWLLQ